MDLEIVPKYCNYFKNKNNKYICYDIVINSKQICGNCYLYTGTEYLLQFGNIGYSIYEEYRKNGYAVEACLLLMKQARKEGLEKLLILIDSDNTASKKVAKKLGAVFTGTVDVNKNDIEKASISFKNIYELSL